MPFYSSGGSAGLDRAAPPIDDNLDFSLSSPSGKPPRRTSPPKSTQKNHAIPDVVGNFHLVTEHELEAPPYTRIAKWESVKTGLKVVWADVPGPVCRFWAQVNTEILNSSGVPHTKEHLTFTASEQFNYSGFLDGVANRMFSHGVNAATDVDNTTYTVESCSPDGMLQLVPVYLSHILFPVMSDEIFATEIYHVDGKGEEGGVVFSEMQGREGSQYDVMDRAMAETLYSMRNGYRSETGGQLDALRKLTLKDIEDYHATAYAPQNVTVLVTGHSVDPERLLKTINCTTEKDLAAAGLAKGPRPRGWIRPFVESSTARNPPVLHESIVKTVNFADSDESVGQINIWWVGPPAHDWVTRAALGLLGEYLGSGSSSPLSKLFVETPDPAAAMLSFSSEFRDPSLYYLTASSVPAEHLPHLHADLLNAIRDIAHQPFDMQRLKTCLRQDKLTMSATLEDDNAEYVQYNVSNDILYGAEDGSDLKDVFNDFEMAKKLAKLTEKDWISLLDKWFVRNPSLTIIGTPSADLAAQQTAANKARVAANKKRFGSAGLARLASTLETAKQKNDHPAPASLLESFKIPNVGSIKWLEVETARSNGVGRGKETFNNRVQDKINKDAGDLPFFVQFDHFPSAFVTVAAFLHGPPSPISALFGDCFFNMPVHRKNGDQLSFQEMYSQLEKLAIEFTQTPLDEGMMITVKVTKKHYEEAVEWLSDAIFGMQFDVDRLKNLVNSTLHYKSVLNLVNRVKFYPALRQRLQQDPASVVKDLEKMRTTMTNPRDWRVWVSGDVMSLERPASAWADHFEHVAPFPLSQLSPVPRQRDLLNEVGKHPAKKSLIYTIPSSQSTYFISKSHCLEATHGDHPAVVVAAQVLSATNSYLWNACRGPGLAYGVNVTVDAIDGLISLIVFKSPDAFAAFTAAKTVVESLARGTTKIKRLDVDAAKSSIVYGMVSALHTPAEVATSSFINMLRGHPADYARECLERVEHVTLRDVQHAIATYILPLFYPGQSVFGATTSQAKKEELVADFRSLGYEVEAREF
ncbi:hypothetical protein JCM10207_007672 [Rhodosporidiobolus poonsookiae]